MSRITPAAVILLTTIASHLHAETLQNIEYSDAGGTRLELDARIPEGRGPFPGAIIVHGGAWVAGDRRRSVQPLFEPLAEAHIASFSISYRLARPGRDGFKLPANFSQLAAMGTAIDDVRQAIGYVKSHAAEYRVDPHRIALIGESAGAQLASMAALRPAPDGGVRAVVDFYGPSDLVKLAQTSMWIPESLRQSLKGTFLESMLLGTLRDLSPVNFVSKQAPPFLLIHGTADTLVPIAQSEDLRAKLRAAGVHCDLYQVADGPHGINWWESLGLTAYKAKMAHWLEHQLR